MCKTRRFLRDGLIKKFRHFIIIFYFTALPILVHAQHVDSTVSARVALVQKIAGKEGKPVAAISVTFVNNTDDDIYIPKQFSKSRLSPNGGKIKTYVKRGDRFMRAGNYGTSIPDTGYKNMTVFEATVTGSRNEIIDKYVSVPRVKEAETKKILDDFRLSQGYRASPIETDVLKPLFLKAHEQYEVYLIKDVDLFVNIPNEYMITFELDYSIADANAYPEKINNYKRYIPKIIKANTLYIKVEP